MNTALNLGHSDPHIPTQASGVAAFAGHGFALARGTREVFAQDKVLNPKIAQFQTEFDDEG